MLLSVFLLPTSLLSFCIDVCYTCLIFSWWPCCLPSKRFALTVLQLYFPLIVSMPCIKAWQAANITCKFEHLLLLHECSDFQFLLWCYTVQNFEGALFFFSVGLNKMLARLCQYVFSCILSSVCKVTSWSMLLVWSCFSIPTCCISYQWPPKTVSMCSSTL